MAKAEGRVIDFVGPEHIESGLLETFPYQGPRQTVTYVSEEFSAVCPFSGLPDVGKVEIQYVPKTKIVELKSLKYYFISYRDVGIYQEHATAQIYQDLFKALDPQELIVSMLYKTRGGIDTTTRISSRELV